jgi:hypothetical protein
LVYADRVSEETGAEIVMRPSIVMWPEFQSPLILPTEYSDYLEETILFLERIGRWPVVRDRLREIIEALGRVEDVAAKRKLFHVWFAEYNRRRRLDFVSVFPEMESFWKDCAALQTGVY